jgi:amino acid permease
LEENIAIQLFSYYSLIVLTLYFLVMFYNQGLDMDRVPAFGDDWRDCIGVIIFNFAFCVTVPSWINEKKPDVDINTVRSSSFLFKSLSFIYH